MNPPAPFIVSAAAQPGDYLVEVRARTVTQHRVTVRPEYLGDLGVAGSTPEKILQASFAFLLEREPNTSILRKFDLSEIERYFPEFREEIGRRVKA